MEAAEELMQCLYVAPGLLVKGPQLSMIAVASLMPSDKLITVYLALRVQIGYPLSSRCPLGVRRAGPAC